MKRDVAVVGVIVLVLLAVVVGGWLDTSGVPSELWP